MKKAAFQSLKTRMLLIVLLLQVPLACFAMAISFGAVSYTNNKMIESVIASVQVQINGAELSMRNATTLVKTFYTDTYLVSPDMVSSEGYFFYTALQKTLDTFESSTSANQLQWYFVYDQENDYFIKSSGSGILLPQERGDMVSYLQMHTPDLNTWVPVQFGETHYLVYMTKSSDFITGVCLDCSLLQHSLAAPIPQDSHLLLFDAQNRLLAGDDSPALVDAVTGRDIVTGDFQTVNGKRYQLIQLNSLNSSKILLAVHFPFITSALGMGGLIWLFFPLYTVLTIPVLLLFLKRAFVTPLNYLQFGFSRIVDNDLSYRMGENLFSTEFQFINRSFNAMVRQIHDLKLEHYEQKIERQKSENHYLRAVMYPHFLLNNLNMINDFAYQGNEEGIHTAVINLSQYLRHYLTPRSIDHTILHDIECIRSYLALNQLTYPGRIIYRLNYDDGVQQLKIPPLLLCTVVENCIKHALSPTKALSVDIQCELDKWRNEPALICTIADNGPGYPEDILAEINDRTSYPQSENQHIGLRSIKKTLYYTYGDCAEFQLSNLPAGGALAVIRILFSAIQAKSQEIYSHDHSLG